VNGGLLVLETNLVLSVAVVNTSSKLCFHWRLEKSRKGSILAGQASLELLKLVTYEDGFELEPAELTQQGLVVTYRCHNSYNFHQNSQFFCHNYLIAVAAKPSSIFKSLSLSFRVWTASPLLYLIRYRY